jgi:hypothetical protein
MIKSLITLESSIDIGGSSQILMEPRKELLLNITVKVTNHSIQCADVEVLSMELLSVQMERSREVGELCRI